MNRFVFEDAATANAAAAKQLAVWLTTPRVATVMVAAGNTPLDLYRRVAALRLPLENLTVFALDEYVGVPRNEPRNCAELLRRTVARAWGIPDERYHAVSSVLAEAETSIRDHERKIAAHGGLDVLVLGLGQNGHLGFNEPGSEPNSVGRLLDLEPISIEANRKWFTGDYAPAHGVTVGMKTILAARQIQVLAYGSHKTAAVQTMVNGPQHRDCPASFLQGHPSVHLYLDEQAAAGLRDQG